MYHEKKTRPGKPAAKLLPWWQPASLRENSWQASRDIHTQSQSLESSTIQFSKKTNLLKYSSASLAPVSTHSHHTCSSISVQLPHSTLKLSMSHTPAQEESLGKGNFQSTHLDGSHSTTHWFSTLSDPISQAM